MKAKEACRVIESNRPTSGYTMLNEALDMAIDALKKQESWAKEPLTMQELREMDGQTVYCLDLNMEVTVFAPERGLINVSNGAFILQARNATLYRDWPKEDN